MNAPSTPGAALRAWRQHYHFSLADVAERAGLGPGGRSWLSRVETGKFRTISHARLEAVAQVLQVTASAISAGVLPPTDALTSPVAAPANSRDAYRRKSPIQQLQRDVNALRNDIRDLRNSIEGLLEEFAWSASQVATTQRSASDAPLIHAVDLKSQWRDVVERIRNHVAAYPDHERLTIWFGEHAVTVHRQRSERFAHLMADLEGPIGERHLVMDGISECFVPLEAQRARGEWLVARGILTQAYLDMILLSREQRLTELNTYLSKGDCKVRDLYTWRAIEHLVTTGRYALDDEFSQLGAPRLEQAQVAATLNNLIGFLHGYRDTYEARFIHVAEPEWPCFWMVKEGLSLLIEMWISPSESLPLPIHRLADYWSRNVDNPCIKCELEIRDDRVIQLFHDYFTNELWDAKPYTHHERANIIAQLERQIEIVQGAAHS